MGACIQTEILPALLTQTVAANGVEEIERLLRATICLIVNRPEDVRVEQIKTDAGVLFRVEAHPADVGKIIGQQGRIARSLRLVLHAMSHSLSNCRLGLDIVSQIVKEN